MSNTTIIHNYICSLLFIGSTLTTTMAFSATTMDSVNGGVTFKPLIDSTVSRYERTPSMRNTSFQFFQENPAGPFSPVDIFGMPMKPRGTPGVCLLDYDKDGDLDMYVTNGSGTANSLYSNQLMETGTFQFKDKAIAANVAAINQDSAGCVFGDIDNDGDHDLYVLGAGEDNLLFENQGDGTFSDITHTSGSGGQARWSLSASMGDINNDGLLDIFVGNVFDLNDRFPIAFVPTDLNEHNQLFLNTGNNRFIDISQTSGIENLKGMEVLVDGEIVPIPNTPASISWAVAMVDIDLDGNIDIMHADDQAAIRSLNDPIGELNLNRGLNHLFKNDGTGQFEDVYQSSTGGWMGLAFADFNSDGNMDYFATNFGDVNATVIFANILGLSPESALGSSSRWFFGDGNNTFIDSVTLGNPPPRLPGTISSPFGWGTAAFDYDNDADTDIFYIGGIQGPLIFLDNPLAILQNDGKGNFIRDALALSNEDKQRHLLAAEEGMAVGDLNNDGFVDVVSVGAFHLPNPAPSPPEVLPNPFRNIFGGPFDEDALISPVFSSTGMPEEFFFLPAFLDYPNGKLSVDINSADNYNNWVAIHLIGTKGIIRRGRVNRDGIGAVVQFTPKHGKTAMKPILGGSSHQSQHSLIAHFGMGFAKRGTIDVLWPGGLRNRYIKARAGERIAFPEIPCDPVNYWPNKQAFKRCVNRTLNKLVYKKMIDRNDKRHFKQGMVSLYDDMCQTSKNKKYKKLKYCRKHY